MITVLVPCRNEGGNIPQLYQRLRTALEAAQPDGNFRVVFIDNASQDDSWPEIKRLVEYDRRVGAIRNLRDFGHVRSPFYGMLQVDGDAVIVLPADLQVPPEIVCQCIEKWRNGYAVALAQRVGSSESLAFRCLRTTYYRIVRRMADTTLLENTPGWGLYDRRVIECFRTLEDPYPYVRGLVSELGFEVATVAYKESSRIRGLSKNNFATLFDVAMLAMTSHSKVPLRLATLMGFALAAMFGTFGLVYLIYKTVYWDRFPVGMAPIVIGLFFFASVQLFFVGLIGEYIGAIYTKVTKRPLVVEKERINFPPAGGTT